MTYLNPRLKHVKKIREICSSIGSIAAKHKFMDPELYKEMGEFSHSILNQCNLLLETKKKKCEHKPNSFIPVLDVKKPVCLNCGRKLGEFEYHECKPLPQPECNHEWKYADIPNGEDGEYCVKCHKKLDYEDIKPSPQPEIIKLDLMQVAHEANILGEDIESEIRDKTEEKINEVIDQLNKITKTK